MILIFSACKEPAESDPYVEQARSLYQQHWHDPAIIDSCLILVEKVLVRNQSNKEALDYKVFLQTQARDLEGLSATVKQLVAIDPKSPYYLSLKAWTLDLAGEDESASQVYDQAESRYRSLLDRSPDDFDLHLEYLGMLGTKGDTLAANRYFDKLASMDWEPTQMETLTLYPSSSISRKEALAFWGLEESTSPTSSDGSSKKADD